MSTTDPQTQADDKETGRVEAFSDGVFAIAVLLGGISARIAKPLSAQTSSCKSSAEQYDNDRCS